MSLITGCHSNRNETSRQASVSAEQAGAKTESIRTNQNDIDGIVKKAIEEDSVTGLPAVKPLTDQTRSASVIIDSMVVDLVNMLNEKEKKLAKLEEENAELKDKNSFKHKLPWILGGLGAVVVALGLLLGRHKITVAGIMIGGSSFGVITYYHILEKILPLMLIVCVGFIIGVINYERQERKLKKLTETV